MPSLLSTKKLAKNQKELLLNTGLSLVEYDAIKIEFPDFEVEVQKIENAIFTSRNAVKAILEKNMEIRDCFCVGRKTEDLLKKHNFKVLETAHYGKDLAELIVKNYKDRSFHFFSGNKRRDELPEILKKNDVNLNETQVYKTSLNIQKIDRDFDGIMFFSPSAVQSYTEKNPVRDSALFCIGETTANEAKKHSDKIIIARTPGIENVIVQVVKYFGRPGEKN
ncbi:uroporphyrinogen-III synthase [Salegentibacter chungangensis]|uniref:Uroporphyrinogen-III synthase n=1 Tax=Salegentibacter chungangensis TaxID=1335724 RepID=A0ABW3NNU6_9FLAO